MISTGRSADFDCSHDVDGSDLATLASDYNRTDCSETAPCEGDINGDGVVNADDLTLFAAEFGRTDCPHDEFYYFHNDHLGTPQRITDQSGTIVWSANYKPFGDANVTTNTITNPFRFSGQYYDQKTGLHYNYFRYYDLGIGRYLNPDPIKSLEFHATQILAPDLLLATFSTNLQNYPYANNPVTRDEVVQEFFCKKLLILSDE